MSDRSPVRLGQGWQRGRRLSPGGEVRFDVGDPVVAQVVELTDQHEVFGDAAKLDFGGVRPFGSTPRWTAIDGPQGLRNFYRLVRDVSEEEEQSYR